jgi:ApeA N-terminal domain 1
MRKGFHLGTPSLTSALWLTRAPVTAHVWLPETPDQSLPAVLTCSPSEAPVLEVLGKLIPVDTNVWPHSIATSVVHGITEQNIPFTLVDSLGEDAPPAPGASQYLRSRFCVVGDHLNASTLPFTNLRMAMPLLTAFIGTTPFQRTVDGIDATDLSGLTFDVENASVRFGYEVTANEFSCNARPWLQVTTARALTMDEWVDEWIVPLNDLVTFATGSSSEVTYVVRIESEDHAGHTHESELMIFGLNQTADLDSLLTDRHDRLSGAWLTAERFDELWPRWSQTRRDLDVTLDLYLETVRRRSALTPRHRFLNLVQAAESLHRRKHRETKRPPMEYKALVAEAKKALKSAQVDKPVLNFLKEHFVPGVGNGVRLAERIDELRDRLHEHHQPQAVRPASLTIHQKASWGEIVARARNDVSHGSSKIESRWLVRTSDSIATIIENEILDSLGIGAEDRHALLHQRR